ncbi:putative monocarboxylate transporter [Hortaea werneckii]|nr:putative monocarboxylate transporter [Hortaea werneckii]
MENPTATHQQRTASSKRNAMLALVGCSLLQLPIWGLPMTFGIFQEAYANSSSLDGSKSAIGVVGTTMNGTMYLSIPVISTLLDNGRWATWRRSVAIVGVVLSSLAFVATSFSTRAWHLIILQGVLAAFGSAMVYAPTTLLLDEWYKDGNRAIAYGVQLSSKNVVGTGCPFLVSGLIHATGTHNTLRIWAGIVLTTGLVGLAITPIKPSADQIRRPRQIPWTFLKHRTFYIYAIGNAVFSSGYGLPQTYFVGFGVLIDKFSISAKTNTLISALGSTLCVTLLWGLKSHQISACLVAFSIGYGFFAGGYSATWAGWIKEMEREAAQSNEAINTGMVYGLLNGSRGVGYVVGGVAGTELLRASPLNISTKWAYGTQSGPVILFTGISALFGGWATLWHAFDAGI